MPPPSRPFYILRIPGHLAVHTGLYSAACVLLFERLSGLSSHPSPTTLLVAFAAGQALYLLDRVKLRDRLLDPADEAADPERFRFLAARSRWIRAYMLAIFAGSLIAALFVHPLLPPLLLAGAGGMLWYAGRPAPAAANGRRRPKDVLLLKNAIVAGGLTSFGAALALLDRGDGHGLAIEIIRDRPLPLLSAAAVLFTVVFADSVACDIEDADADRRFGTDTLPSRYSRAAGWIAAAGFTLLAAALSIALIPSPTGPLFAGLLLPTLVAVAALFPRRPRDAIDLRLPLIALALALLP